MTAPVQPQVPEDRDARIRQLEKRKKILQRHRKVAEGMYGIGPSREYDLRLEANQTALDEVEKQLKELTSAQGTMRNRMQMIERLTKEP